MAVEEDIYSLLTNSTLLVGTISTRVYPVKGPQNVVPPFAVYQRISGGQQNGLSGYHDLENPRMQIDAYSTSYSAVKTIADNIHIVMDGATTFKAVLLSDTDLHEEDEMYFRVSMDFSVWNRE